MDGEQRKKRIYGKAENLAREILEYSRNLLLIRVRFLEPAVMELELVPDPETTFAVDGGSIHYEAMHVLRTYQISQELVTRNLLHMILHCIFQHPFVEDVVPEKWNLACDIAVEEVISGLAFPETEHPAGHEISKSLSEVREKCPSITAEKLYNLLVNDVFTPDQVRAWSVLFQADDHEGWYHMARSRDEERKTSEESENNDNGSEKAGEPGEKASGDEESSVLMPVAVPDTKDAGERWKSIADQVKTDLETFSRDYGDRAGSLMLNIREVQREKTDYSRFLRRFSVYGEAPRINDEEFNYIAYSYGLKLYGNIPLVEPLEYKEEKRIREFVIAIDTSASTSGELVKNFLERTCSILASENSFFRTVRILIIQCDKEIQSEVWVHSGDEMKSYSDEITVKGGGGTDFRPVFQRVQELIDEKRFSYLKGLIYFTDGRGVFPERKPSFETAFVIPRDSVQDCDPDEVKVPGWAYRVVLDREEIEIDGGKKL